MRSAPGRLRRSRPKGRLLQWHRGVDLIVEGCQGSAYGERDHQEETQRSDKSETLGSRPEQSPHCGPLRLRLPDLVQRRLHFAKDAGGGNNERYDADCRGQYA